MTATLGSRTIRKNPRKQISKIILKKVVPPAVALIIFLVIWQILCLNPNFKLPGPIETFSETWDPFIIHPFFDNGESDKGLGWQILNSLGRVGLGFSLAAIVGIFLGILIGANKLLYSAVDPIFQVLPWHVWYNHQPLTPYAKRIIFIQRSLPHLTFDLVCFLSHFCMLV